MIYVLCWCFVVLWFVLCVLQGTYRFRTTCRNEEIECKTSAGSSTKKVLTVLLKVMLIIPSDRQGGLGRPGTDLGSQKSFITKMPHSSIWFGGILCPNRDFEYSYISVLYLKID